MGAVYLGLFFLLLEERPLVALMLMRLMHQFLEATTRALKSTSATASKDAEVLGAATCV